MKTLACALALGLAACAAAPGDRYAQRSEDRFAQVRVGMTRDDALAILGPPDQEMPFPRSGTHAWSYIYQDPFGYLVEHSLTFGPDGRMVSRTIRRMNDGGEMR